MKYQRIYLASHVIYGSSRLGTKDYLPGQLYSLVDYQQAQPVIDTSILNGRRPWYSGGFNDDIEPGATTVWGHTQTGPFLVSERIGEKQYELSNHLGNVQATVSDNRYEVADKSTDSIIARHPALRSAYDYYPFGMLMPGRYVSDTSQHCVTVTRPTWVWKEVTVACWDVYAWEWPSLELVGEATARVDGDAVEINTPNASDAVGYTFPVTPNVQQTLTLDIERMNLNDKASVEVLEQRGKEWVTLAETPVEVSSGGLEIPFRPSGNYIKVVWHGRILVWVRKDCISKLEWVEEDQLVTICDGDKDKYRFGFNGIEKVNEIAGIGNHYQALYGDYSSRTGFRWNLDPKATSGISPYAMFKSNPIFNRDVLLDSAWATNNKWDDKMAKKYETDAPKIIKELEKNGEKFTCDDLALTTVMTFAKNNNLPFKWQTGSGTFDASSDDYNDFKTFKHDVLSHSGAPDFQLNTNTRIVGRNGMVSGGFILNDHRTNTNYFWQKSNAGVAHHIQMVVRVSNVFIAARHSNQNISFVIKQGNFNDLGRYSGSDDPNSSRYLGVPIQTGLYNAWGDVFTNISRDDKPQVHFSWKNNNKLEYRLFNFTQWNK